MRLACRRWWWLWRRKERPPVQVSRALRHSRKVLRSVSLRVDLNTVRKLELGRNNTAGSVAGTRRERERERERFIGIFHIGGSGASSQSPTNSLSLKTRPWVYGNSITSEHGQSSPRTPPPTNSGSTHSPTPVVYGTSMPSGVSRSILRSLYDFLRQNMKPTHLRTCVCVCVCECVWRNQTPFRLYICNTHIQHQYTPQIHATRIRPPSPV